MAKETPFKHLLSPLKMGDLTLRNRVILASMTRNRNLVPQQVNVDYYTQRANAGLVLTEGTLVAPQGTQWPEAPGIYNDDQVEGWRKVVDSVHQAGGLIFLQVVGSSS
jgi:2,4-dienoyl-CoA reductase-like NADH-dependent reductase (Old Yellow Enzyme family)